MSDRRQYAVLAATVLVVLLFGLLVLRPRATQAAELRAQTTEAQAEYRALTDQLTALQDAALHRKEFEAKAARIEGLIPRFPHLVRTIRLLNRAALQAGIDLREMAPSTPNDHLTVAGAKTITTTLIVEGGYDRIESFITRLEQLDRAMQVTAYTFTPQQEGNRTVISAALTTEMYVYDPKAGATTVPAAPTTPVDATTEEAA